MGINFNVGLMRRVSLMFLFLTLLAGVSAHAQKIRNPQPQPAQAPVTQAQYVYVQDDKGEGFVVFNVANGAYKAKLCNYNYSFSGIGSVKIDGCSISFSAVQDSHAITAFANICDRQAQSSIQVKKAPGVGFDIDPVVVALSDSNTSDSGSSCAVAEPPPPSNVPSEIIVQSDADGSFLHLSTSGEYKFIHCEDGVVISGRGKVTIAGDMLYFEHITNEYRVLASVNLATKEGKAAIEVFTTFKTEAGVVPEMREYISDNNLADNTTECGAKK